jgi:hypothetical protein
VVQGLLVALQPDVAHVTPMSAISSPQFHPTSNRTKPARNTARPTTASGRLRANVSTAWVAGVITVIDSNVTYSPCQDEINNTY